MRLSNPGVYALMGSSQATGSAEKAVSSLRMSAGLASQLPLIRALKSRINQRRREVSLIGKPLRGCYGLSPTEPVGKRRESEAQRILVLT